MKIFYPGTPQPVPADSGDPIRQEAIYNHKETWTQQIDRRLGTLEFGLEETCRNVETWMQQTNQRLTELERAYFELAQKLQGVL